MIFIFLTYNQVIQFSRYGLHQGWWPSPKNIPIDFESISISNGITFGNLSITHGKAITHCKAFFNKIFPWAIQLYQHLISKPVTLLLIFLVENFENFLKLIFCKTLFYYLLLTIFPLFNCLVNILVCVYVYKCLFLFNLLTDLCKI